MQIKDEDLIKFCLGMKEFVLTLSSSDNDIATKLQFYINSFPTLNQLSDAEKQSLCDFFINFVPESSINNVYIRCYHERYYNPYDPFFFIYNPRPTYISNVHNHSNDNDKCAIVILAIFLALSALLVTLKTILEMINNIDGIFYNEGRDRALFNLAAITSIYSVTTYIAVSFLFTALVATYPCFLSAIISGASGIIFSYCLYFIVDLITDKFSKVNPNNPYANFTMTTVEADNLECNGIDSLKARAVIIFLNAETSESSSPKLTLASVFNCNTTNSNIDIIRSIRRGEKNHIYLNNKHISLEKDPIVVEAFLVSDTVYVDGVKIIEPSAPSL